MSGNLFNELGRAVSLLRSLPKSLLFNLRYFPLTTALRLPVLVSHRVVLRRLGGRIELGRVKHGIVKIGFGGFGLNAGLADAVWHVEGGVRFAGRARIGAGAKLFVAGEFSAGDNFDASYNFTLFCDRRIELGPDTLLSWNVTMMDNDGHAIRDGEGRLLNAPQPIRLGANNWIGCDCHLLKGAAMADHSVLAAGSLLNRAHADSHLLLGGRPAKVLKQGIGWQR